ncbi:hypothetical protein JMUB4039_1053 [Leptotrichia trevisanii]|nr:hypothetical protein JMUB4039_1053 [Leptotrichia trevisanii]
MIYIYIYNIFDFIFNFTYNIYVFNIYKFITKEVMIMAAIRYRCIYCGKANVSATSPTRSTPCRKSPNGQHSWESY